MPNYPVRAGELKTFENKGLWTYVVIFKGKEYKPGKLPSLKTHFDKEAEAHRAAVEMHKYVDAPPQSPGRPVKKKAPAKKKKKKVINAEL